MNRKQKYADHESKIISDPLDENSYTLAAWENDEVVGTVRSTFLNRTDIGDYYNFYNISPHNLEETSITTRLMIHPRYRRSMLAIRLAQTIYQIGLEENIAVDLIDCNDHLVSFFLRLGYRTHRSDLLHPEYGEVTVMKLQLHDISHLQQVQSPFCPLLQDWLLTQKPKKMEYK